MRRNNHHSARVTTFLSTALLLWALTACSPNLTPGEQVFSQELTAETIRATPSYYIDIDPQSTYLVELEQNGADLQLGLKLADRDLSLHDMPLWLRGSESALIQPGHDQTTVRISVIPVSVGHVSTARLSVTRLATSSSDDSARIIAEQSMAAATLAFEGMDPSVWLERVAFLDDACRQFEALEIHDRYQQCLFNQAAITYVNLMDWPRAMMLGRRLKNELGSSRADPFARQVDTFVIMAMIERDREDTVESYQRRLDDAEQRTRRIIDEFRDQPQMEVDRIFNMNIAGYLLIYTRRFAEAAAYFQMAAERAADIGAISMEINATQNHAYVLKESGNLLESTRTAERLITRIRKEQASSRTRINLHTNLAMTYSQMGYWDQTIHHFTTALSFNDQLDSDVRVSLMTGLTNAYLNTGNPSRARVYLNQALSMIDELTNVDAIKSTLRTAARLEQTLGHTEQALAHLDEAIVLENDTLLRAEKLMQKARLLTDIERDSEARQSIAEALEQFDEGRMDASETHVVRHQLMLAEWYLTSSDFQPGHARALLDDAGKLMDQTLRPSLNRQHAYLSAYHLWVTGETDRALESAITLKNRIWKERFSNSSSEFVSGFIDANQRAVTLHLELYLEQLARLHPIDQRDEFLALAQTVFQSADALRSNQVMTRDQDAVSSSEHEQLILLESDIRRINYELTEVRQGELDLRNRLISELEERNRTIDLITRTTAVERTIDPGMSVSQLQDSLKPNHTVLTYWLGEKYSIGWRVDADSFDAVLIDSRQQIEELTRRVHAYSSRPSAGGTGKRLRELSTAIIEPLFRSHPEKSIVQSSSNEHPVLAVIPTGALSTLPFGSLMLGEQRLLESYDVLYLPGLSEPSAVSPRPETTNESSIAIYADPQYVPMTLVVNTHSDLSERSSTLAPLPGTREEATRISAHFAHDDVLERFGIDANRFQFLSDPLDQFRYLHIASHAVVDPAYPSASTIMLSVYDQAGNKNSENAVLSTTDIERLELSAELVVLSACDTAMPQRFGLNSASGLHQSFLNAGAQAVLGSSWRVADQTTSRFMSDFYDLLIERKQSPHTSLAMVQRQRISANDPLYDWAGWLMYVTPSTIFKPH